MNWWSHLYMGKRAAKSRQRILAGIREKAFLPDTYVITLPESGNHIFDIRPVMLLDSKEQESSQLLILGVACGHREASQVVRDMVDDMYQATGAFNWNAYMKYLEQGGR